MSDRRDVPRVLAWVLRRITSREAADAAVGDALEVLADREAAGSAPRSPSLWIRRQLALAIASEIAAAAPRVTRAWAHTLRDAVRGLRHRPAQVLFIVAILSIGMSAATVTFSVVDATVLRPLPFEESDRIVSVGGRDLHRPTGLTTQEFEAIRRNAKGLESFTSLVFMIVDVKAGASTHNSLITYTDAVLFDVLKIRPALGHLWTADHDLRDRKVAVISHAFWHRQFGGGPDVLGRDIRIFDEPHRIVGVLPPDTDFRIVRGPVDVWVPSSMRITGGRPVTAIGRLAPGVSIEQAGSEISGIIAPHAVANPQYPGWRLEVIRWQDTLVVGVRGWMLLALGGVTLVLLIACANSANLMLARSWQRARELAVRAALGAPRRRLGAVLLMESLLLAAGSSLCALLAATWGIDAVKASLPDGIFRADAIALNQRVFAAGTIAALATGIICGLVPAWQAARVDVLTLMKDGSSAATRRRGRWRSAFVVAQAASVAALLVVSTLFLGSFARVMTIDLGFDRSNLIGVTTLVGYRGTIADVQRELRAVPGVAGVAAASHSALPLVASAFGGNWTESRLERHDAPTDGPQVSAQMFRVTPDYFDVARIVFRQGSAWQTAGADAGEKPIVIDEIMARVLFGSEPAVGRLLRAHDPDGLYRITGVVSYVRVQGPERSTRASAYYPLDTASRAPVGLLIRSSVPPASIVRDVRAKLLTLVGAGHSVNPRLFDDAFRRLTATRRFNAALMSVFALLAIAIGGAGIYAAMASAVAQQTREIGVRLALGASAREIRRAVLTQAARYLLLGLAIGLPAGWLMSRAFGSIFFEVAPGDVAIHASVAVVLAGAGLAAAAIPARRASRVDPVISLRAL